MILYENEKYSCVKCIRGHRSTSCKHIDRVLIKVNKRGRRNLERQSSTNFPCSSSNVFANKDDIIVVEDLNNVNISKKEEAVSISSTDQSYVKMENDVSDLEQHVSSCCNSQKDMLSLGEHEDNCRGIKEPLLLLQPSLVVNDHTGTISPESISKPCCSTNQNTSNPTDQNTVQAESFSYKKQKPMTNIDIFKNNNVFLETKCSCADNNCQCENCIIHRLDEDLDSYISSNLLTYPSKIVGKGFIQVQNNVADMPNVQSLEINKEKIEQEQKTGNFITLKEIFQKGFNNLMYKINEDTLLKVDDKELLYVAWHPQVDLYYKDIISLSQLVKILETL